MAFSASAMKMGRGSPAPGQISKAGSSPTLATPTTSPSKPSSTAQTTRGGYKPPTQFNKPLNEPKSVGFAGSTSIGTQKSAVVKPNAAKVFNNHSTNTTKSPITIRSQTSSNGDKQQPPVVVIQSFIRMVNIRRAFIRLVKTNRKRNDIIQEILTTERTYVGHLRVLVGIYQNPLKSIANCSTASNSSPLTLSEISNIFSNIDAIVALNSNLLETIEKRVSDWSPTQRIGDVFLELVCPPPPFLFHLLFSIHSLVFVV